MAKLHENMSYFLSCMNQRLAKGLRGKSCLLCDRHARKLLLLALGLTCTENMARFPEHGSPASPEGAGAGAGAGGQQEKSRVLRAPQGSPYQGEALRVPALGPGLTPQMSLRESPSFPRAG